MKMKLSPKVKDLVVAVTVLLLSNRILHPFVAKVTL
jgi:hypothetical protein